MSSPIDSPEASLPTQAPEIAGAVQDGQSRPYLGRIVTWLKDTLCDKEALLNGLFWASVALAGLSVVLLGTFMAGVILAPGAASVVCLQVAFGGFAALGVLALGACMTEVLFDLDDYQTEKEAEQA